MADIHALLDNLRRNGFSAVYFDTAGEAAAYLDQKLDGRTIGMGGSMTIQELGLVERLSAHNQFYCHWTGATAAQANAAEVYLCSVNGLAETGEIINIDGTGNRVSSTIYGHKELYLVVGVNKVEPDFEKALWRARNIASPKNAKRLNRNTPCAVKGDRCYNCDSPERICRALTVLWRKPTGIDFAEVIVVGEALGL
ncbi:lactate utilization protein [Pseudoflavonifractor sp. 524-17]|uniref:lactate utilization protein n=1 Tax=Pseudoflavonifractor sp. 524-17 TaxID=2304577 RepID=UPI00137AA1FE|nr:lactate utilization protein [Pseudoflavonifractor sp. 524-17]NCE63527.1 lactate utilization protein [Pseudoflavonifractor sp. 524-17]